MDKANNQPTLKLTSLAIPVRIPIGSNLRSYGYDDKDETKNELIGMERAWMMASTEVLAGVPMPKRMKFKLFQLQCKASVLPPPIPFATFEANDWNHVNKCDETKLLPGYRFKAPEELKLISRRHGKFPFCHPGPVENENMQVGSWYYADMIVQELKFIGFRETYYNVRWIGYEDE